MTPSPETKTMTEKLDSVPLKACAGCGQLYPLNGNGHMCKPTPAADKVGADSVDLESTFGPILKDKFPDYDSLTRFHAAYALAEAAIAAMQARSAEPAGEEHPLAKMVAMDEELGLLDATPTNPERVVEAKGIETVDEDWLTDVIDDSIDMDWTGRIGAKAIMRELAKLQEQRIEAKVCHVCGAKGREDHAGHCSESW